MLATNPPNYSMGHNISEIKFVIEIVVKLSYVRYAINLLTILVNLQYPILKIKLLVPFFFLGLAPSSLFSLFSVIFGLTVFPCCSKIAVNFIGHVYEKKKSAMYLK